MVSGMLFMKLISVGEGHAHMLTFSEEPMYIPGRYTKSGALEPSTCHHRTFCSLSAPPMYSELYRAHCPVQKLDKLSR